MKEFYILKNPIQDYGWGSHTAIPELLGTPTPSQKPQAELWIGAHRKASSEVLVDGNWQPLPQIIEKSPGSQKSLKRGVLGLAMSEQAG